MKRVIEAAFLMFCLPLFSDPINIKTVFHRNQFFHIYNRVAGRLRAQGIVFNQAGKPDMILASKFSEKLLNEQVPIVLLEDVDYAAVSLTNLKGLFYPEVKAVFQSYSLDPLNLNNKERFGDCYHFGLVNERARLGAEDSIPYLSEEHLKKIKCLPCTDKHLIASKFDKLKQTEMKIERRKPIDVLFIGRGAFSYPSNKVRLAYGWHRRAAINAINGIQGIQKYVTTARLAYPSYLRKMRQAKIVVSPWGWGEFCYRDFEAMLLGAVLIKPDTSFVKTKPNLYQNNITYVPCKLDFSDLRQKVYTVLRNYDKYDEMRRQARKVAIEYTLDTFARDFAAEIKNIFASST